MNREKSGLFGDERRILHIELRLVRPMSDVYGRRLVCHLFAVATP